MKIKYAPNDVLPYTIKCIVCRARFHRMTDWEEHEPTHDVADADALQEPLVFNFGTPEESSLPAVGNDAEQTDQQLEDDQDDDTESPAPVGRVRLPRHVRARGKYIPRDAPTADAPTSETSVQCQWTDCNSTFDGEDANKDLFEHLTEHFGPGQKDIVCEWEDCTAKPQRDNFYMKIHVRKHAGVEGMLPCQGGCGATFNGASTRSKHHQTCARALTRRGENGRYE
ncbi:hypothetical protein KCU65_g5704, partial [Aureobasidium melanogenum]